MDGRRYHPLRRGQCGGGWSGFRHVKFVIPDEYQVVSGMGHWMENYMCLKGEGK